MDFFTRTCLVGWGPGIMINKCYRQMTGGHAAQGKDQTRCLQIKWHNSLTTSVFSMQEGLQSFISQCSVWQWMVLTAQKQFLICTEMVPHSFFDVLLQFQEVNKSVLQMHATEKQPCCGCSCQLCITFLQFGSRLLFS